MWNKFGKKVVILAVVPFLLTGILTGCTDEKQENEDAYRQIGINCMKSNDYEGAISAFDSALDQKIGKIGDEEVDICYYKAAAQYASGDTDGALATYTSLVDYDDTNSNAYYLRGVLYLSMQNNAAALADFSSAVANTDASYELYLNIYQQLTQVGLSTEAQDYLDKALELKGKTADDYFWRGRIYQTTGKYEDAIEQYKAAIDKKKTEANLYLAQVYEAQGDTDTAETYYQAYIDSGIADSEAMNALGKVEMNQQNYKEAIEYFKSGLEMDEVTNEQELLKNLVLAYENNRDFESAKQTMETYLSKYPDDEEAKREYTFLCNR